MKQDFFKSLDVESSNILIFNHALDDIYRYFWSNKNKIDYFTFTKDICEENSLWIEAIKKKEDYLSKLKESFRKIIIKLKCKNFIIIRCYPSSYEVYHKQSFKIQFHRNLTLEIVKFLSENGFKILLNDSKKIDSRFKLSGSFFVLQKI